MHHYTHTLWRGSFSHIKKRLKTRGKGLCDNPKPTRSTDMTDPIAELFSLHLPSEPVTTAELFADGMRAYHKGFKTYRDKAMHYEALPEYQNLQHTVITIPRDQFWPYTPFFRKMVAEMIQELFKTKITYLGFDPVSIAQVLVFVDEHKNRWIMTVEEDPSDLSLIKITMFCPRSNTPTSTVGTQVHSPVKQLNDPAFASSGLSIMTHHVSAWFS